MSCSSPSLTYLVRLLLSHISFPHPQCFCSAAKAQPNIWRWGRKGTAVVAWTVVGLEVTVVVRDLAAAKTTLPEVLDSIRQDYGPAVAEEAEEGTKGGKGDRNDTVS